MNAPRNRVTIGMATDMAIFQSMLISQSLKSAICNILLNGQYARILRNRNPVLISTYHSDYKFNFHAAVKISEMASDDSEQYPS